MLADILNNRLPKLLCKYLIKKTTRVVDAITKSIVKIDSDLKKTEIDWVNSGSTCCLAIIKDKTVYLGNVGDSRAILFQFKDSLNDSEDDEKQIELNQPEGQETYLAIVNSTTDHDFEIDREYRRINRKLLILPF